MENVFVSRYKSDIKAKSDLHKLDDALDLLSFLKAEDFVASQLINNHSKSGSIAKKNAKRIASHANLAAQYAALSLNSPPDISFLPGYYCILNLAKCISLSGPYSHQFDHHSRWHGATYNARGRPSHSILTDEIKVRGGGALALFYKTLTHKTIAADKVVKLREFYHLIPGIGLELSIVTGVHKKPWFIAFRAEKRGGGIWVEAELKQWLDSGKRKVYRGNVRSIPCLAGFNKKPKSSGIFVRSFTTIPELTLEEQVRSVVKTEYLHFVLDNAPYGCYEQGTILPMPREFASALAFFHLSSVCRYNPEFMSRLVKSKSWPMLLSLRRQGLYYFIISTWSYMIQKDYILQ